jgi:thiamine pyrophosphate-dependent acetolactate synthase large subunit-like protein
MHPDPHHARIRNLPPEDLKRLREVLARRRLNGCELCAEALRACGVRNLSGLTGTPVNELFGAAARSGIRVLGPRHQFTAAVMAATENHLRDQLRHAVCLSAGPAVTHAVSGILHARDNYWPLLVLGSRRALDNAGCGYFQELDVVPVMQPLTKWAATVPATGEIVPMIERGCRLAMEGRPGPVYLDLPEDVLHGSALPAQARPPVPEPPAAVDPAIIPQILTLLQRARRPLLCLGEELRRGFDAAVLLQLVERLQLPFITTPQARGIVSDAHPLCANTCRTRTLHRADTILAAGTWFDWRLRFGRPLAAGAGIIHIHPVADELGRNVAPALAVHATPMPWLAALAQAAAPLDPRRRAAWREEIAGFREESGGAAPSSPHLETAGCLDPASLMDALRRQLPDDAVIVVDASIGLSVAQHGLAATRPFSWLDPGRTGCIGSGIPQALGAALAYPGRPVIALVGDTGFGMSGFDLETAVRHALPLKVLILNNGGISGHLRQRGFLPAGHPESFSRFSDRLDYGAIAQALGFLAESIDSPAAIAPAICRLLAATGPACLNAHIDPLHPPPPIW